MKKLHVLTGVLCIACIVPMVGCSKASVPTTPVSSATVAEPSRINASISISVTPRMVSTYSSSEDVAPTVVVADFEDFEDLSKPKEFGEQLSYIYGYATMATALRTLSQGGGIDTNIGYILKGVLDAGYGSPSFFNDEETAQLFSQFQNLVMETLQAKINELACSNLATAKDFLSSNGNLEGVVTTSSGLQYQVFEQGSGPRPSVSDTVVVDYQISLLNGTIIDSTYIRGNSDTFSISWLVVEGFKEGLQLMPVGSKYRFWVTPELGYGVSGGPVIEPNSMLIIDVELKGIK